MDFSKTYNVEAFSDAVLLLLPKDEAGTPAAEAQGNRPRKRSATEPMRRLFVSKVVLAQAEYFEAKILRWALAGKVLTHTQVCTFSPSLLRSHNVARPTCRGGNAQRPSPLGVGGQRGGGRGGGV